mmetsp:Transcript_4830/g.5507  ORF Transcript_4830/g.5507 Transcript_4830/m.5507 type:complete len:481 (+) Transcript_4830:294-1736(+)
MIESNKESLAFKEEARRQKEAESAIRTDSRSKGLSFKEGLSVSLNYNLSFSILVFPFHIARAGWSAVVIYFGAVVSTYVTSNFIAEIMNQNPELRSFSSIGMKAVEATLGPEAYFAKNITLSFFRFLQHFELFTYLVLDFLIVEECLVELKVDGSLLLFSALMLFPTILFSLSSRWLSREGVLSTITYEALYALVLITGLRTLSQRDSTYSIPFMPGSVKDFFGSYGGILLMFSGHAVYPSIFSELENKKDAFRIINYTYLSIIFMSVTIGVILILGYGKEEVTDLPTGHLRPGSVQNWIGQLLMMLKTILTHPTVLYPIVSEMSLLLMQTFRSQFGMLLFKKARKEQPVQLSRLESGITSSASVLPEYHSTSIIDINEALPADPNGRSNDNEDSPFIIRVIIGVLVSIMALLAAMVIPSLNYLLSLSGALFAISLNLTLPSLSYLCIMPTKKKPWKRIAAAFLFIGGLVSTTVSLIPVF